MPAEIKYLLETLDVKDPSVSFFKAKLLEILGDPLALASFADSLKLETQSTKDFPEDRVPFYDFYLAIAWQKNNTKGAKAVLSNAVHDFRIRGLALNEGLSEWLFSVIHYDDQKYERAQRACETAMIILQQLITRCEEESKYEKAKEIKKHLSQMKDFQEKIKGPAFSQKVDSVRSKLESYHAELTRTFDDLKEKNERIPPTLVAAKFYIYRTLAPAHSAYSKVPPPKTETEKEIYDDLLNKVGFFEVIEQLVALEQEFEPTATREELLDRINKEWDDDVRK